MEASQDRKRKGAGARSCVADPGLSRIRQTAMLLGQFPLMGRAGHAGGTREFTVTGLPYLIVYQLVTATDLDILTVLHTRRKCPPEA